MPTIYLVSEGKNPATGNSIQAAAVHVHSKITDIRPPRNLRDQPLGTRSAAVDETVLTTCPRDCYDTCGILVHRRGGLVTPVRGNPAHAVSRGLAAGDAALVHNAAFAEESARRGR